ncbi:MAG TPA: hypothetical protein VFY03_04535 [Woeseiaceae bacterium]|nr:hypothetical protein [Woeseiaceae bacterium]
MKNCPVLVLLGASLFSPAAAVAGPEKFASEGFIDNEAGEKCRYRQEVISGATHFHGDSIASTIGEIVFDDPRCMRDSGNGLDGNKTLINKVISTWYSHPDAEFDSVTLHDSSLHQDVGQCIQSKRFAAIGIVIDYVVTDDSIVKVLHGPALEGCLVHVRAREPGLEVA